MKKIIFLMLGFFMWQSALSQYPSFTVDTVRFVRPSDTTVYASGDIIADSGAHNKYFAFSKIGQREGARGEISNVTVQMDTANSTNATVKVRLFSVSDTTGLWASLPVDNAAYQSAFQVGSGYYQWIGDVAITLAVFGTTAGGATSAEGTATAALPYYLYNGKLYCVLLATGAFEPKHNGAFRIIVGANKQY